MSNQSFTNKQLMSMSIDEIKKIIKQEKRDIKKDYEELEKKRKLIEQYKNLAFIREKVKKGKVAKKKVVTKPKVVKKPKVAKKKVVTKPTSTIVKTFEDYFEECIKNRKIPKDTPSYLRKALERAIEEYDQGIEIEKSSLNQFAKKYIIKGRKDILPGEFFDEKKDIVINFLKNHRNTKVRFVLCCIMEKKEKIQKDSKSITIQDKSYFSSITQNNYKSSNVEDIYSFAIIHIINDIELFQINGSGWYFKNIDFLEIHTNEFKPIKGSSYIPLPDWLMRKKAIVSIRNKDNKCFIWSVLRYLHPREKK